MKQRYFFVSIVAISRPSPFTPPGTKIYPRDMWTAIDEHPFLLVRKMVEAGESVTLRFFQEITKEDFELFHELFSKDMKESLGTN